MCLLRYLAGANARHCCDLSISNDDKTHGVLSTGAPIAVGVRTFPLYQASRRLVLPETKPTGASVKPLPLILMRCAETGCPSPSRAKLKLAMSPLLAHHRPSDHRSVAMQVDRLSLATDQLQASRSEERSSFTGTTRVLKWRESPHGAMTA